MAQPTSSITNSTNSTNSTNNTTNNLLMMTPLEMKPETFADKIKEKFTLQYMLDGQKGVAKFAVDVLLRDKDGKLNYVCTDPSRLTFRYNTESDGIKRDIHAKQLTDAIAFDLNQKDTCFRF